VFMVLLSVLTESCRVKHVGRADKKAESPVNRQRILRNR